MALDPRIALQGAQWQAPDVLGALRQGQDYRRNQMIMRAETDAAARNAMLRRRAATVDPTDRAAVNAFVSEVGPEATPYLEAWGGADTLARDRAAEARAQGEFAREERGATQEFLQNALSAVYNDPSDANIAAVTAQAVAAGIPQEQMDAYAARFLAVPAEQRRGLLAGELATSPDGLKILERFAPNYEYQNAGGSLVPQQMNPLAPGATPPRPVQVTPSPNRPVIVQTAEGFGSVVPGQSGFTPVTDADGNPVMPYQAPSRAAPAPAADMASVAQSRLEQATNLTRLIDEATANTSHFTAGIGSLTAAIPGTPAADLAGTMESIKSNLAFDRLQQMRDESRTGGALGQIVLRELDMLASVWASTQQSQSPQQLRENLGVLRARSQALAEAYEAMVAAGSTSRMPPVGAEGTRMRNRNTGAVMVSRGGRWVPE